MKFLKPSHFKGRKNGYVMSVNGKLRKDLLDCKVFNALKEAQVLIE